MKKIKKLLIKYREIIAYLVVGGLTTVVSLGSYYLMTVTFLDPKNALQLQMANVFSWILAVTFAFFMDKYVVFRSDKKGKHEVKEAVSFYSARVLTLLADMGLMFLQVTVLGWNDKIAKLIVQVVVTIGNYLISKFLVFKKDKTERTN